MKCLIFDLDGTLAESKQPVPDEVVRKLEVLSNDNHVVVISGAKFDQFKEQLLEKILSENSTRNNIFILPTCGAQLYKFSNRGQWEMAYHNNLTETEKSNIIYAIEKHTQAIRICGIRDQIEDRGSQITFSALGQKAHHIVKKLWDPTNEKKAKLRDLIAKDLPEFEVKTGGSTSIDVTRKGIDKAYGINKLLKDYLWQHKYTDIYFYGDALYENGNDYPVRTLSYVKCIEVSNWKDTLSKLENLTKQ